MDYIYPQKILFKHCDPAGIVFYPRFFVMMNDCVEAFFDDVLEFPFSDLHKEGGVPTAEISTRFPAPSRIGDNLKIKLSVTHLGRTSCGLRIHAECGSESRFEANSTLVLVNKAGRPRAWPETVRDKINPYLEDSSNEA